MTMTTSITTTTAIIAIACIALSTPPTIAMADNNISNNNRHLGRLKESIIDAMSNVTWNWASYMVRLCGNECRNGALHFSHNRCVTPSCFPCDCDPSCHLLGTCCPTLNQTTGTYFYNVSTSKSLNPMQWFNRMACVKPPFSEVGYLTVKTCPYDWKDNKTRENCENLNHDSLDSFTLFSDKKTGLVFQNVHCAICNGFRLKTNQLDSVTIESRNTKHKGDNSEVEYASSDSNQDPESDSKPTAYPWTIQIQCSHYQNLYHVIDQLQFYLQASKLKECEVTFVPPYYEPGSGVLPVTCTKAFDPMASSTEQCTSSDAMLNRLCDTVPRYLALRVNGYRNIFCYMCGNRKPRECLPQGFRFQYQLTSQITAGSPTQDHKQMLPPFQLLFNPSPYLDRNKEQKEEEEETECRLGYWNTDEGECVPASCSPGKILDNSTCNTAITDIRGLAYNVKIVYVPPIGVDPDIVQQAADAMQETITRISEFDGTSILKNDYPVHCFGKANSFLEFEGIVEIVMSGFIVAPYSVPRDEFEGNFSDTFLQDSFEFSVGYGDDIVQTSFKMICNGPEMCQEYGRLRGSPDINSYFDKDDPGNNNSMDCWVDDYDRYTYSKDKDGYIDVGPSLTCPYVVLNMTGDHTIIIENGTLVFTVLYMNQTINLPNDKGMEIKNDELIVCLDVVNSVLEKLVEKTVLAGIGGLTEERTIVVLISYYSQIAFMILSVVCLLVAVVTYAIFPTLRVLPGLNNMSLCISLASAQISLLITSIHGTSGRIHETYCLVHAVILHYSWLASFCWMNTCCIHMYRVFTSAFGLGALTVRKTFCHYCIYSFTIPGLICLVTVVTTTTITHGASQGYDTRICFLDFSTSSLIPILSLLVPFGASILVNVTLFCFTIAEIVRVTRHTPASNKSSHGVSAYVKLSALTGLFIAVTAVAAFSGNAIMTLIAGPLAALQGVFIFFSFIFNKHVLGLYTALYRGRERGRASSMSSSAARTNKKTSTQVSDV